MENLKITFIKKFREHLDLSMQTAIEYYNTYDADLEKSVEMLKNDFINKLQKELNTGFEETKEALEHYKYNYESAYPFLKEKNIQAIDEILMNEKISNREKLVRVYRVYNCYDMYNGCNPINNFKQALMFFYDEYGYEMRISNSDYKQHLRATSYLEDSSILDILNTL
jgi:hypothetical protein